MEFESKRIFELHIFKDTNKTNWTNASVHVFPLSSQSFPRFNRADPTSENRAGRNWRVCPANPYTSRDGLLNLWKCGSEQLAFLQKYIDTRNEELQKKLENIHKEYKRLKEEDKLYNDEEERRFRQARDNLEEKVKKEEDEKRGRQRSESRSHPTTLIAPPPPPPHPYHYDYSIPPPPPPVRSREFLISKIDRPKFRKHRSDPSIYETTWTLESVELDLQPYEAVFEADKDRGVWKSVEEVAELRKNNKGWLKGSVKITKYQLSEQGKCEFAIVLSRYVTVKNKNCGRDDVIVYNNRRRRRSLSPYADGSEYGIPISPEASVYGEEYAEEEEQDNEKETEKGEGGMNPTQERSLDEEEDHDIEVIPAPDETCGP